MHQDAPLLSDCSDPELPAGHGGKGNLLLPVLTAPPSSLRGDLEEQMLSQK